MPATNALINMLLNGQPMDPTGDDITAQQQADAVARAANGGLDPIAGLGAGAVTTPGAIPPPVAAQTGSLGGATAPVGGANADFVPAIAPGVAAPPPPAIGATQAPDGNHYVPAAEGWAMVQREGGGSSNTHTGGMGGSGVSNGQGA